MFTVKHHTERAHHVYACDSYMIVPAGTEAPVGGPNVNPEVLLMDKPFPVHPGDVSEVQSTTGMKLEAYRGSVIYIENAEGHTVDVLRPSLVSTVTKEQQEDFRKHMEENDGEVGDYFVNLAKP